MSMNWIWLDRVSLKCKKFIFPSLNPGRIFGYICIALSWFLSDDCADVSFQFVCWYSTSKCIRYIIYIIFTYIYTQIIWDMPSTRLLPTLTLRSLTSRKWKGFEMHWIGSMHWAKNWFTWFTCDSLSFYRTMLYGGFKEGGLNKIWTGWEPWDISHCFHIYFFCNNAKQMNSQKNKGRSKQ